MAVYKTKTGRWLTKISYRDADGKVKSKEKTFDLKREALDFETKFRVELVSNPIQNISYKALVEDYLLHMEVNSNKSTIEERRRIITNFFKSLMDKQADQITKKMYLDVYLKIAKSDYSHLYKRKIITQLKSIAQYAYDFYDLEDNTKTLPRLVKPIDDYKEMQVWDVEELNLFLDHVDNIVLKTLYRTLFYTGLRRGEAIALQKSDLVGNTLLITKAMKHYKNGFLPLKTASSKRKVELDNETLKQIRYLIDHIDGDFIFGGLEPLGISTIQREFTRAKKASGVSDIRLHDLRHSHASMLINRGANIVAVSRRLGHSNTKTTLEVYTHLLEESQNNLLDLLE